MSILDSSIGVSVPKAVRAAVIIGFVALAVTKKMPWKYAAVGAAASWFFLLPSGTVSVSGVSGCGVTCANGSCGT